MVSYGNIKAYFVRSLFLLIVLGSALLRGQDNPYTAINDVAVFDGEVLLEPTTVLIHGSKIESIGSDIEIPEGADVIDGKGMTLLPGLVDAHVHVISDNALRQSLMFGVTTVIDMFMSVNLMQQLKAEQADGPIYDRANLISPGTLATAPGGHGTQYGLDIPTISRPEQAQEFVDARIAEGSDFIKIIYDEGRSFGSEIPTVDYEILKALIKAGHKRNKKVIVHALTLKEALDVMEAGADGLAHLYLDGETDPQFGEKAAQKGVFFIPTMSVLQSGCGLKGGLKIAKDEALSPFLSPADVQALGQSFHSNPMEEKYAVSESALRQLKDANVPILAGTDVPNPGTVYGASIHSELSLLVAAGMSPIEALRSATSISADHFDMASSGRIAPGKLADLVLVQGDPIKNIEQTRHIVSVWKSGKKVDRESYHQSIQQEWDAAEKLRQSPPPAGSESGMISDFETDLSTKFGAGWSISTDAFRGGQSSAEFKRFDGGANTSSGSMEVTGEIVGEGSMSWAGVFFSPGATMMAATNLSSKSSLRFWAKGGAQRYAVMFFTQKQGFMPSIKSVSIGEDWQPVQVLFSEMNTDGSDLMGVFIGASGQSGPFQFFIDDVSMK